MMKNLILISFILVGVLGCQSAGKKQDTGFKPMAYVEEKLPNGLTLLWIADEKLPYFSLTLMNAAGSTLDPQEKPGVASLVSSLLDKGTVKKSATQIADDLEQLGLSFAASTDEDMTTIGLNGLSLYNKEITESFFSLVTESQFVESELQREKNLTRSQINKAMDRPSTVASMAFEKFVFKGHPYGVGASLSGLQKISRQDILNFYKAWYQPQFASMAIVGRFTAGDQERIRKLFGGWKATGGSLPVLKEPDAVKPGLIFVERAGLKQAEVRIGHLGIARNSPDYLKLRVANTVLGESFIGRLFTEIRVKRGLTYSIYSNFDSRAVKGSFLIGTFTRLDKIGETVKETLAVYDQFTKGVSEGEINDSISYLKGSFPQVIETGQDLAKQLLILKRYGVDMNYLATYMTEISKLKPKDINAILPTYFHPSQAVVIVYGPPGADLGLEQFGPVTKVKALDLVK